MTLLIKSDNNATRHMGNIFGVTGATDFTALLDFERGVYRKRNAGGFLETVSLDDAVSVSLARESLYYTKAGQWAAAAPNTPRIHYLQDVGRSGLLVESFRVNLFLNSDAPSTQTIDASSYADAFILEVSGTGSATISGAITDLSTSAEATEGSNVYGKFAGGSVTVTVSGSLDRVQLLRTVEGRGYQQTPIVTTFSPVTHRGDIAEIKPAFFADAVNAQEGTVVAQFTMPPFDRTYPGVKGAVCPLALQDSSDFGGRILKAEIENSGLAKVENFLPGNTTPSGDASLPLQNPQARTFTLAISFNGDVSSVSHSGAESTVTTAGMEDAVRCILGARLRDATSYPTVNSLYGGVINKVAFFDRKLTSEQFMNLSSSWK